MEGGEDSERREKKLIKQGVEKKKKAMEIEEWKKKKK